MELPFTRKVRLTFPDRKIHLCSIFLSSKGAIRVIYAKEMGEVEPHEMVKELKRIAEIELKSRAFTG